MLRRAFILWASLIGVLAATTHVAFAEQRRALIIGANDYSYIRKLQKAVGDAEGMQAALRPLGFETDLLLNPDRRVFNAGVAQFKEKLRTGDVAVIHFSGHGVAIDGENYLLPIDVPASGSVDKEMMKGEGMALSRLLNWVRSSGARTLILIIDACRDNPYSGPYSRSFGETRGLVQIYPSGGPGGIFIMYSAGYNQSAADRLSNSDPEPTSVYTRTLLRKIAVEGKSLTDLAREVREDTEALAATVGHRQRPAYYDEHSGSFYFVPPRSGPPAGVSLGQFELAFWTSIQDFAKYPAISGLYWEVRRQWHVCGHCARSDQAA